MFSLLHNRLYKCSSDQFSYNQALLAIFFDCEITSVTGKSDAVKFDAKCDNFSVGVDKDPAFKKCDKCENGFYKNMVKAIAQRPVTVSDEMLVKDLGMICHHLMSTKAKSYGEIKQVLTAPLGTDAYVVGSLFGAVLGYLIYQLAAGEPADVTLTGPGVAANFRFPGRRNSTSSQESVRPPVPDGDRRMAPQSREHFLLVTHDADLVTRTVEILRGTANHSIHSEEQN